MSSGFISEGELAEQRKRRQEEWEKVRTAADPKERPEEPYDPRSLFDRLQEQKLKRDVEYEEAHKLKNMIKGLDDDEVDFLELVDRTKMAEERKKHIEEEKELKDFKAAVASLQEKSLEERLKLELKQPNITNKSSSSKITPMSKLLAGAVIKKSTMVENVSVSNSVTNKRKISEVEDELPNKKPVGTEETIDKNINKDKLDECANVNKASANKNSALKCIGVLPGLGSYENSSDSDSDSSDIEEEHRCQKKFDLLGRTILPKEVTEEKQTSH